MDLITMQLVTFQRVDLVSKHSPLQQYVRMLVPQPLVVSVESLGDQRIVNCKNRIAMSNAQRHASSRSAQTSDRLVEGGPRR